MITGPNITKTGLVLSLDVANIKSFRGEPTVNLVTNAATFNGGWNSYNNGNDGTFITEFGTTGYKMINRTAWNGIYYNINLINAGTYTFSAKFRFWNASTSTNAGAVYVSNYGGGDTAVGPSKDIIGEWQHISHTVNVTIPTNVYFFLISWGGNQGTDTSTWDVTQPQIEQKSYSTPFVNGTRGATVATGGGWEDLSGNGNNGELVNGVIYNSSKRGNLVFDGVDDYVLIPNTTIFSGSQTYETFFVKDGLGVVSVQGLLTNHKYDETANIGLNYLNDSSRLGISIGYTDGTREYASKHSNYVVPNNIITHACLTFDLPTNTVTLYVNGIYDSSWVLTKTVKFVSNYFYVGQWSNYTYYYFSGKIFNSKFYNKTLTAAEVLQNYNATKTRYGLT